MSASMDGNSKKQEESGPYIWLRYASQYTKDGRTHTVEMSVPVPLGASAEEREQLFNEAEAGMQQLATHMDQRSPQGAARAQMARSTPQPQAKTKPAPAQPTVNSRVNTPGNRPAAMAAPPTATQPNEGRGGAQAEPQTGRSGETMRTGNLTVPGGEPGSNMPLPQFIHYIKENMDLTPKQAMELLNVRSLTTGINLREALEQLKEIVGQSGPAPTSLPKRSESDNTTRPDYGQSEPDPIRPQSSGQLPRIGRGDRDSSIIEMRVPRSGAGFVEEIGPEDLEDGPGLDEDLEELEDLPVSPDEFSEQELERARTKISSLRESQGATTASPQRLQVLSNVVLSQISDDQLRELIEGVWNITVTKKLKVDQVEALISWAKLEDDFIEQVEAVLAVLEEERYARGNR
ncbi:hypothetical protein [Dictyobacter formicarum]|uniref:Uncharacterized protein n=1 Tax=Dictyobacter formicarum TaxID=2778368 RepID=A0ABQ3VMN7_9CHLR|nr:hypothetical protein [Dictyobacter formicarum]GHO86873.1 hypothetical protein KSZ_48790 [Dictyobacter formicarum]